MLWSFFMVIVYDIEAKRAPWFNPWFLSAGGAYLIASAALRITNRHLDRVKVLNAINR
jgi:hypothetical protein